MKNNKKKIIIIALVLLVALLLYFVVGTFAKYTSTGTAQSTLDVAKWAIKLGNVDIAGGATDFTNELTLETDSSSTVESGKIAPGTTASGSFTIDPNGTEVAVKYKISIGTITYSGQATAPNITVTSVKAGNQNLTLTNGFYEGTIPLNGSSVEITVTATWTSNGDATDTTIGYEHGTVTVPVTVTVEQNT